MTELTAGGVTGANEGSTDGIDGVAADHDESGRTAAERDRGFARQVVVVALAWTLLWTVIIASLFAFGDAISAAVV